MRRDPQCRGFIKVGGSLALALSFLSGSGVGIANAQAGDEWTNINGDATSARYSTLTQINPQNLGNLQVAWEWEAAEEIWVVTSTLDRCRSTSMAG
jgi:hypothetical protein